MSDGECDAQSRVSCDAYYAVGKDCQNSYVFI